MTAAELAVRYSNLVDTKTRNACVLRDGTIFNNRYEGDPKAGAVKVRKTGAATVKDYDKTAGIDLAAATSEWITVDIDKDKAINEIVDGYDAAAIPDGIIADRLDEAGYALATDIDKAGALELVTNGTAFGDTTALTNKTVYGSIVDAGTKLTEEGVPMTQRYILVSPATYALVLKSDEFIKASDLGDAVVQTGAVGQINGMSVYVSNNLGENVEFIAGHPSYSTRVMEWSVPIRVISLDGDGKHIGASAVQGRKVYAHKVTNGKAILVKKSAAE